MLNTLDSCVWCVDTKRLIGFLIDVEKVVLLFIISPDDSRDILVLASSRHRRRRRSDFLVYAITQKIINIVFSNLAHMLRLEKGRLGF